MHIVTLLARAISVRFQFVLLTTDLFFQKKIGGHQSFCGVTDTPVLDFWWRFKARLKQQILKCEYIAQVRCFFINVRSNSLGKHLKQH